MDLRDHQQARGVANKTLALCVVSILCVSIPASIYINRYLDRAKQNHSAKLFHFNLVPFYDAVSECAPEAQSMGLLNTCILERMRTNSFPFVRLFYVVGSFLFLGVTLQLSLAQVSMLVWGLIMLCNFVFFVAIAGAR